MTESEVTRSPAWCASMGQIPPYTDSQGRHFAPQSEASDRFMTSLCTRYRAIVTSQNPIICQACACFWTQEEFDQKYGPALENLSSPLINRNHATEKAPNQGVVYDDAQEKVFKKSD